jgi:D-aminoacyl-tRNA deacylase
MRTVLQRVIRAHVRVGDRMVGAIGRGLLALVGVEHGDGPPDLAFTAGKIRDLRLFEDEAGRMNRSLVEIGGSVLVVSQFTLLGDCRRGRRPSFDAAAPPADARAAYESLLEHLRATGLPVEAGEFQAMMHVELVNDGPVTLLLDSRKRF